MCSSYLYELEPIQNGCLLKFKEERKMSPPPKTIDSDIKNHMKMIAKRLEASYEKLKATKMLNSSAEQRAISDQRRNKKLQLHMSDNIHDVIRKCKLNELPDEKRLVPISERLVYWEKLLDIGEVVINAKDFKTNLEYGHLIDSISFGNINDDKSMNLNQPSFKLSPYRSYLENDKLKKGNIVLKEKKKLDENQVIFVEDVLPGVARPAPGVLAPDVDLQAIDAAYKELTNLYIPYNPSKLVQVMKTYLNDSIFEASSSDPGKTFLHIKQNMMREDWLLIRDLYMEFRSKGKLQLKQIFQHVLFILAKYYPRNIAKEWLKSLASTRRKSALRIGILLLNIFHISYLEAIREAKDILQKQTWIDNVRNSIVISCGRYNKHYRIQEGPILPKPVNNEQIEKNVEVKTEQPKLVNKAGPVIKKGKNQLQNKLPMKKVGNKSLNVQAKRNIKKKVVNNVAQVPTIGKNFKKKYIKKKTCKNINK